MSKTKTSVAIVNYGMGNLRSVWQALTTVAPDAEIAIVTQAAAILAADRLVLPGQGAMPDCMRALRESGLLEAVRAAARTKPILGICIGQQILFDWSAEGNTAGLGLIPGKVMRFALDGQQQEDGSRFKVPQIGWNYVHQTMRHPIWEGIPDRSFFYFVHSYYVIPDKLDCAVGETTYGVTFPSAVARDNIVATQFHPEKSAQKGLRLYRNFVDWRP